MKRLGIVFGVLALLGCNYNVRDNGNENYDAAIDVQHDLDVITDADIDIQQDAADDADVFDAGSDVNDGDVFDADSDIDADVSDADITIPGTLTYMVSAPAAAGLWWDGAINQFVVIEFSAGDKDATVNNIALTFSGTADVDNFTDMQLIQNGIVVAHSPMFIPPNRFTFNNIGFKVQANQTIEVGFYAKPDGEICLTAAFDVQQDFHISATTDINGLDVEIEKIIGPIGSVVPVPTFINGFRLLLDAETPSGSVMMGSHVEVLRFNIISGMDVLALGLNGYLFINPLNSYQFFQDVVLWDASAGSMLSGPRPIVLCGSNSCDFDLNDDFYVEGSCQINSYTLTMDITGGSQTVFHVALPSYEWDIADIASGMILSPSNLPDELVGNTLFVQ